MALTSGTRLGPYEILAPIGAGGMGEVYKANDTRLDRTVAIKVLPEHLAESPERKARFEREAKAISQLNHPHICTLYDVGEQDGIDFIVMEYIEGETLAERLKKGALPLDKALKYGVQIADGLDTAHRAGIVHRDLKPANAMLTKSGVKLLDFGLARLVEGDVGPETSDAPTRQKDLTKEESIIGTLQYMAPEQLERKRADARTDIFAFGAVLYEMMTGKKAFEGKTQASLIGAIMTSDPPPISQLQAMSPPALDHVVKTCLAKDPDERWQTAGDVERQLKWIIEGGSQLAVSPAAAHPAGWRPSVGGVAAALVLSALSGLAVWSLTPEAPRPVMHFVARPPFAEPINLSSEDVDVAITPDGTRIVYPEMLEGRRHLFVRSLVELGATPLAGLGVRPRGPFISPDGHWVGFVEGRTLFKVSILGGPPVALCDLPDGRPRGASWGADDTIIFATGGPSGLWQVSAGGGEPKALTTPEPGEGEHWWPEILPGGDAVLFTIMGPSVENSQIAVLSRSTGTFKALAPGGSNPRYARTGHIVYGVGGTLRAVGFDLERLEITSDPVPVLEGVLTKRSGAADFSLSHNGSLVYVAGPPDSGAKRTLVWVDRQGREELLTAEPRAYTYPRISPDGTRLALDVRDQDRDIWIWDFARETLTRFTFRAQIDARPVWTPDGQRIVFESHRGGQGNIFAKPARGTGPVERLTESPRHQIPISTSPDGAWVVFQDGLSRSNLTLLPSAGGGEPQPLLQSEFNETNGEISPDGRWLAYQSDESGQFEIYVRPFPNVDEGLFQISRGGGTQPLWAPSGRELFYRSLEGSLMAVPVQSGGNLVVGNPEIIIEQPYSDFVGVQVPTRQYDISLDGKRFLMIKEADATASPRELILVQNWFDELKRLVPTDN